MVLILSVLIGIALDFAGARPADTAVKYYATRYDHIDVEAILNNRRMVNYYSACLLSKGPCPPEGVEFKRILPEALQTNCGRCTEKQATVAYRAIKRIRKEYPKIWNQLTQKWDPDEMYVSKFESAFGPKKGGSNTPVKTDPDIISRFGNESGEDTTGNNITGIISLASTTSPQDSTTSKVLTSTNIIPSSFTTSTTTKIIIDNPYPPYEATSLASTTKTTANPTSTSTFGTSPTTTKYNTRSTTRPPVIPGLIPLNTFFTNPQRPLVNLNLGTNLQTTVSELVRGLGAIGFRVMETGADIAQLVINNFARPLRV